MTLRREIGVFFPCRLFAAPPMSDDDPTPPEKAPDTARERSPGEKETGENDLEGAPPGDAQPLPARSFAALLVAAAGLTGALALGLFPIFAALGTAAAPYWAVGVAVVGGIVMRRVLLHRPSVGRTVLFTAVTIGGALAGLALANVLFS